MIFSPYRLDGKDSSLDSMYSNLRAEFVGIQQKLGIEKWEGTKKRRRQITLHSFRRYVKTTISDLGLQDYSEYFIGHSGSEYYSKPDKEKIEDAHISLYDILVTGGDISHISRAFEIAGFNWNSIRDTQKAWHYMTI